ncbi:MAG: hypothetical protein ABI839_01865 [Verrucomicrobiota bacterium]
MTAPVVQAHPASQHDIEQTLPNLSADERAKLYSAHEAAMHNPDLAALRERYLREKRAYREELQRALLKADPSVQPILEKVRKRPAGDK